MSSDERRLSRPARRLLLTAVVAALPAVALIAVIAVYGGTVSGDTTNPDAAAPSVATTEAAPAAPEDQPGLPIAVDDVATAEVGETTRIAVLGNDIAAEGDVLGLVSVDGASAAGGAVEIPNLVENGDGALGNNRNFSGLEFVPDAGPGGMAAFRTTGQDPVFSDRLVPVDTDRTYAVRVLSRADPNPGAVHFVGLAAYDELGRFIQSSFVNYTAGTETELATDLAPGDRRIRLVDASGWNDDDGPGHLRNIIFYPYVDGTGTEYEPYTYSRFTDPRAAPLWEPGAIDGDDIVLAAPWGLPNRRDPEGVWRAGTLVANNRGGSTFTYFAQEVPYTDDWTEHWALFSGVRSAALSEPGRFPPGTASVRLVVVPNRQADGSRAWYAGFELIEAGVVDYTPPAGFTGTDTFDYTVRNRDGTTATATVTVSVAG